MDLGQAKALRPLEVSRAGGGWCGPARRGPEDGGGTPEPHARRSALV